MAVASTWRDLERAESLQGERVARFSRGIHTTHGTKTGATSVPLTELPFSFPGRVFRSPMPSCACQRRPGTSNPTHRCLCTGRTPYRDSLFCGYWAHWIIYRLHGETVSGAFRC